MLRLSRSRGTCGIKQQCHQHFRFAHFLGAAAADLNQQQQQQQPELIKRGGSQHRPGAPKTLGAGLPSSPPPQSLSAHLLGASDFISGLGQLLKAKPPELQLACTFGRLARVWCVYCEVVLQSFHSVLLRAHHAPREALLRAQGTGVGGSLEPPPHPPSRGSPRPRPPCAGGAGELLGSAWMDSSPFDFLSDLLPRMPGPLPVS